MPVYPGTESPVFAPANTFEKDGFQEMLMTMTSHTGTHIDAPAHILPGAPFLDDLPVEYFVGKAVVIDISGYAGKAVPVSVVRSYGAKLSTVEFVIFKTGWSQYWGTKEYYKGFPILEHEAVTLLTEYGLRGIGIDAISIDAVGNTALTNHHIIFAKRMISIENLTNLDAVGCDEFLLSVLPLKITKADGSPVRAIAMIM